MTKEEGKKKYMAGGNEDWNKVLDENPLPNAIYFRVKKDYVNVDTLENIKTTWKHKPMLAMWITRKHWWVS